MKNRIKNWIWKRGIIMKNQKENKEKPVIVLSFDGTVMDIEPAIIATYRELFDRHHKRNSACSIR